MEFKLKEYFIKLTQDYKQGGRKSPSATAKLLHSEYGFGVLDAKGYLNFTEQDVFNFKHKHKKELDKHQADIKNKQKSGIDASKEQFSTKSGASPVARDFVLINALSSLKLNREQLPLSPINSLGFYLNVNDIFSIEHRELVLVENLAVMAVLKQLKLPVELNDALFIYRGDVKKQQNTRTAIAFFRRWKTSHTLICFGDFDPAGSVIALKSGASHNLIPAKTSWDQILTKQLEGAEENWWKQNKQKAFLDNNIRHLPAAIIDSYNIMARYRRTWQQEHMISHQTPLVLSELIEP